MTPNRKLKINIGVGIGLLMHIGSLLLKFSKPEILHICLILDTMGMAFIVWGCVNYTEEKGRSKWLGLLGVIGIFGFAVLIFFKKRSTSEMGAEIKKPDQSSIVVIVAIIFFLALHWFFPLRTFLSPTSGMAPTIPKGSGVMGNMSSYYWSKPQRWDAVLFHPTLPAAEKQIWIKRIIGLAGEQINYTEDGRMLVDGKPLVSPAKLSSIVWRRPPINSPTEMTFPYTVPPDCYFVVGDNTDNSSDSRYWGALPRKNIVGKVFGK